MVIFQNEFIKGQFLSIYDETESNGNFHVCRYLCGDDSYVLFQAISTRGFDDGFYLIPIDCIYRIDMDDEYTKRIERLFALQNQHLAEEFCLTEGSLLVQLLRFAKQNRLITSFFLEDENNVTGWISDVDIDGNYLFIEKLTDTGEKNGNAFISTESIEKIICNSGEERCIEMLKTE